MLDSTLVSASLGAGRPTLSLQTPSLSTAAKIGWSALIAATLLICYFSHLGAIGFVGPDEPRYAWIARAMAETGDWVTPKLYGKPWFEKPPLFYWGAALSFKLFGVSEAAARLPSAISALLATLAMGWLAWRMYGGDTACWLLLLLPTTVGMIGFSHAAATDMPFSAMLTIAMVCAAVVLGLVPEAGDSAHAEGGASPAPTADKATLERTPWLALILFGFFLGLAVLAKGPAAIVLCGGAVFFWALFTKRWRDSFRLLHPAAIAAFCVTALPWYILCAVRNPDFLRIFIIEHNFKRFLTPEFQHIQPFWFYAPILLAALLPWVAPVLSTFARGTRVLLQRTTFSASAHFFLWWAGFCLLFFTVSRSKLPGYILPSVPAIAILVAHDLHRRLKAGGGAIRWILSGIALTLAIVGVVTSMRGDQIPVTTDMRPAPLVMHFYLLMIIAGLCVGVLLALRGMRTAVMLALLSVPTALLVATADLSQLDAGVSARSAAFSAQSSFPEEWLSVSCTYKLRRGPALALNFYLRRELPECGQPHGQRELIFTSPASIAELEGEKVSCLHYIAAPAVAICADPIRPNSMRIPAGSR